GDIARGVDQQGADGGGLRDCPGPGFALLLGDLHALALGDVQDGAEQPERTATRVILETALAFDPMHTGVRPDHAILAVQRRAAVAGANHATVQTGPVVGMHSSGEVLTAA